MAWPQSTHFLDFIDDSTPYVSAAFLNAVQDEVIRLNGKRRVEQESWGFPPGAPVVDGANSPDGRFYARVNHAGSLQFGVTALATFPWSHVILTPPGFVDGFIGFATNGGFLLPHAVHTLIMEAHVQRRTLGGAGVWSFDFGFSSADITNAAPSGHAAYFQAVTGTANWLCWTRDGAVAGFTDSTISIPADTTTRVRLRIEVDVAAVRFYINDALVATRTTNLPAAAIRALAYVYYSAFPETADWRVGPLTYGHSLI